MTIPNFPFISLTLEQDELRISHAQHVKILVLFDCIFSFCPFWINGNPKLYRIVSGFRKYICYGISNDTECSSQPDSFDQYISSYYTFIPNSEWIVFPWKCHCSFVAAENLSGVCHLTPTKSSFCWGMPFVPANTKTFSTCGRTGNFICTGCWSRNIFVDLLSYVVQYVCLFVDDWSGTPHDFD